MEEINIKDLLAYIRSYLYIIICFVVVFTSTMFVYDVFFKKPLYTTYTTIVLVKDDSNKKSNYYETDTIDQNDINLNQKLVATYRQIIKSKLVLIEPIRSPNARRTQAE